MDNVIIGLPVAVHATRCWFRRHRHADRGEGVISAAIAVLIIAFIGAAMWLAFNSIWEDSEQRIRSNVEQIGASG